MSTNFVKDGHILDLTAPSLVVTGGGVVVGNIFGIAQNTISSGATGPVKVDGVHDIAKVPADVISQGGYVYWNTTSGQATVTSSGNIKIGVAESTVSSGGTVVRTRLNGAF
jgi:predicted RecA/RadA family phage recombinase